MCLYNAALVCLYNVALVCLYNAALLCNDAEVRLLDKQTQPDLNTLIRAQSAVARSLESKWFKPYERYIAKQKTKEKEIKRMAVKKKKMKDTKRLVRYVQSVCVCACVCACLCMCVFLCVYLYALVKQQTVRDGGLDNMF